MEQYIRLFAEKKSFPANNANLKIQKEEKEMYELRMEMRKELRLTQKQRLEQKLFLRLALLHALRGEKHVPTGTCPRCNKKMTPSEIMRGFNRDPNDFTTKCPKCKTRFEPRLVSKSRSGTLECKFLCAVQTLAKLPGKETLSPAELNRREHAMYQSALVHFGTMQEAFKKAGIAYRFKEKVAINTKVRRLLGRLPDAVIARYASVSARRISAMRRERGIGRWHAE